MGAGGKAGGKIEVTDYRMSMHYRVCHGPIDALLAIYVGEKEAWTGNATTEQDIAINRPDLFGGNKKEGGAVGVARFLPGGPTQVMPEHLAARVGLTSATCPAYRTMASVFFTGSGSSADYNSGTYVFGDGFLWASNNPYLKNIWMKVRRAPRGLDPSLAMIGPDANPAHIIYECLTNTDWGQGGAPSGIDTASFNAAAQTLYNESFGLSLSWTKQATIEDFVSEIQDHILATLFVNPRTGLMTIKLIRADYDPDDLPVLDVNNFKLTSFSRKAWGETVNEIVVTWTNPENEQEETVAAQNNANIAVQGGIISDSRNYYGVRNADLAQKLAFRDLATASAPLASYEGEVDRSAWDFLPGGCARLIYPLKLEDGTIENIDTVIRINTIDYGKPGSPAIKISAMDDIFAQDAADFDPADGSQWDDPSTDPAPAALSRIITAPAYAVLRETTMPTYPSVYPASLVSGETNDTFAYNLYGEGSLANGATVADLIGSRPSMGHATLQGSLVAEATTVIPSFGNTEGGPGPRPAGFVIIGDVGDKGQEIALLASVDEDGWHVSRGILDTVPRAWPIGTPVWFATSDKSFIITAAQYTEGETAYFRVAPSTSLGTLPLTDAPIIASVMSARPHLPNRPADVKINGTGFGVVDLSGGALPANVTVTWANRNRLLEDNVVLSWTEATMAPEDTQTTNVRVLATDGTLIEEHTGLTGVTFDLPTSGFSSRDAVDVAVYAERGGLRSLQSHRIRLKLTSAGTGSPNPEPADGDPDPGTTFPDIPPWYYVPYF